MITSDEEPQKRLRNALNNKNFVVQLQIWAPK